MANVIQQLSHALNRTQDSQGSVERFHGPECYGFLDQLGFMRIEQMDVLIREGQLSSRKNRFHEGVGRITLAKMASLEGNCKLSHETFQELLDNPKVLRRETGRESALAYLHYEYADLLDRQGDGRGSLLHLKQARVHARSNRFKNVIEFQFLRRELGEETKKLTRQWRQHLAYFDKYNMSVMGTTARRYLAHHNFKLGEYEEAATLLEEAHFSATEHGYSHLKGNLDLLRIDLLVAQDRAREALKYAISIEGSFQSSLLRARLLQKIAEMQEAGGDAEAALQTAREAVELSHRFSVLPMIAHSSIKVGRLFHRMHADITKAFFYYQKGYGAVQDLLALGYSIQGELAQVVDQYITFLEEHFPGEVEESANEDLFSFSKGMTWVQIKDLFHYNLFLYHYMNTGVGARTLEVLDFPASSFYSATERLRSRGITFPNFRRSKVEIPSENYVEGLQQYCRMHRERTWVDINDRFEKDMLTYQYKLNNYNKKNMAKTLGLAYSGIVNRTKYLTSKKS